MRNEDLKPFEQAVFVHVFHLSRTRNCQLFPHAVIRILEHAHEHIVSHLTLTGNLKIIVLVIYQPVNGVPRINDQAEVCHSLFILLQECFAHAVRHFLDHGIDFIEIVHTGHGKFFSREEYGHATRSEGAIAKLAAFC